MCHPKEEGKGEGILMATCYLVEGKIIEKFMSLDMFIVYVKVCKP